MGFRRTRLYFYVIVPRIATVFSLFNSVERVGVHEARAYVKVNSWTSKDLKGDQNP